MRLDLCPFYSCRFFRRRRRRRRCNVPVLCVWEWWKGVLWSWLLMITRLKKWRQTVRLRTSAYARMDFDNYRIPTFRNWFRLFGINLDNCRDCFNQDWFVVRVRPARTVVTNFKFFTFNFRLLSIERFQITFLNGIESISSGRFIPMMMMMMMVELWKLWHIL